MTDLFGWINPNFGGYTPPDDTRIQAMRAEQMAEYHARRSNMQTNLPWELRMQGNALRNVAFVRRKPTMTLAEWDARRAAFKPWAANSGTPPALP